ncbi:MAG: hypothetical protein CMJ36_05955 [Phycisphaerae bacterium]|nr:hypothetical protein [Phycisphaerae bacterium]
MGFMDKFKDKANEMAEKTKQAAEAAAEKARQAAESAKVGAQAAKQHRTLLGRSVGDSPMGEVAAESRVPHVMMENGETRPFTDEELGHESALDAIKTMFEKAKVISKPRHVFDIKPNPHHALGHYARFKAESVGLDVCKGVSDSDGSAYIQVDHEYFLIEEKGGAVTVTMCVDSNHFNAESASMLSSAFGGAMMGGADTAETRSKKTININYGNDNKTTAGNIAMGAGAGAVKGLMKANAAKKAAKAAQLEVMTEHIKNMLDQICELMKSELMDTQPHLLVDLDTVPERHEA